MRKLFRRTSPLALALAILFTFGSVASAGQLGTTSLNRASGDGQFRHSCVSVSDSQGDGSTFEGRLGFGSSCSTGQAPINYRADGSVKLWECQDPCGAGWVLKEKTSDPDWRDPDNGLPNLQTPQISTIGGTTCYWYAEAVFSIKWTSDGNTVTGQYDQTSNTITAQCG